ncbi:MAG: thiaminase II [Streptosporangiaceae bacterium]
MTITDSARVTEELWPLAASVLERILVHPFLAGLASGDLDRRCFRYYVVQDTHYLRSYARALSLVGAHTPDETGVRMFAGHAANAIAVERSLHADFLRELGEAVDERRTEPAGPTTLAYTSFQLAAAQACFVEGLGAVLPCYWLYREVGRALAPQSSPEPLYARWIDTYAGEEFARIVTEVLALTDRAGEGLGEAERSRLRESFAIAARYEWMFWDAAYRRETWPV